MDLAMAESQFTDSARERFPNKREAWLVFSVCVFAIHVWSTIVFLYNFPSLILKANIWQIISVLGFALVFAFLESLLLFGFLVLLAAVLPQKLFRERFVYLGARMALGITVFALLLNTQFMQDAAWAWIPVIGLSGAGLFATLRRPLEENRQYALADRFTLTAGLYLLLDVFALLFIVGMAIIL